MLQGSQKSLSQGEFSRQKPSHELMGIALEVMKLQEEHDDYANELGSIRATLLVNFGKNGRDTFKVGLEDEGSIEHMMLNVLTELTKRLELINGAAPPPADAEIERLSSALHRVMAHPDYDYSVIPREEKERLQGVYEENLQWDFSPDDICMRRKRT